MIGGIIGALIGYRLGDKYLTPSTETPLWTGHLGGDLSAPAMMLTRVRHRGRVFYRVIVIMHGNAVEVSAGPEYAQAVAALQMWDGYLRAGGTVEEWLASG